MSENAKTPDEIKTGVEFCKTKVISGNLKTCDLDCPYRVEGVWCRNALSHDTLAYIEQLEADNAQQARCIENLTDKLNATNDALAAKAELAEQYRWERDVAIAQLEQLGIGLGEKVDGKVPKWISVKKKLPEKQLRVIVCNGHGLVTAGWRSYNKDPKGNELWVVGSEPHHANDILYWMPLPEPPVEV